MNEHAFRNLVSGRTPGLFASAARIVLSWLSAVYRCVIFLRNAMFDRRLRSIQKADVPVISVGNLTTGGTGKTPVVALIVEFLQKAGQNPAIISRGYRAVDDDANDEKRVLERLCPGVRHEQNSSRFKAAQKLTQTSNADSSANRAQRVTAIVMDDGFQHRQLHRDFNIVLIDATNPFGYGFLLPRGLLREPVSSLRRADLVLITRADMASDRDLVLIESRVRSAASHLANRMYRTEFRPTGLIGANGQRLTLEQLLNQPVVLVSGIGNPEAFAESCRRCGMRIVGTRWFPDHHHYSAQDLSDIATFANSSGPARVVTTLKDLVKLPRSEDAWALEIAVVFQNPHESEAVKLLVSTIARKARSSMPDENDDEEVHRISGSENSSDN